MDGEFDDDRLGRPRRRGGYLILFVVSFLVLGVTWQVSALAGWEHNRSLWIGFGGFLAVMTIVRPWWFWENRRARRLRGLVGDATTIFLYLGMAFAIIWVGLFTNWKFGR